MLKEPFALLMSDEETDEKKLSDIVEKISIRRHIKYNKVKLYAKYEQAYILYNPDKEYVFEMARNKHLKIIWKDEESFMCISFKNNPKGEILYYLEESNNKEEFVIEGDIIQPNIKSEYKGRKIMLVASKVLDENESYLYKHFGFCKNKE